MLTKHRVAAAHVAFIAAALSGWSAVAWGGHPLVKAWSLVKVSVDSCGSLVSPFVQLPALAVAYLLPVAGVGLTAAALVAASRVGHSPAVAPALRFTAAALAAVGVAMPLVTVFSGQADLASQLPAALAFAALNVMPLALLKLDLRRAAAQGATFTAALLVYFVFGSGTVGV